MVELEGYLSSITFTDSIVLELKADSIVVVVGSNNSGKTAAIAAIMQKIVGQQPSRPSSVASIVLERVGSFETIKSQLSKYRIGDKNYQVPGWGFHENNLREWWSPGNEATGFLGRFFANELTTRNRLQDCDPVGSFDVLANPAPDHPFQVMYVDHLFEERLSAITKRAFRHDFVIDRHAGNSIAAYVGDRPTLLAGEERHHASYTAKIRAMRPLAQQGDGIRSFVSIVGRILTERRPIQLIDEPEAFLHPPQARLVAQTLVEESAGRQIMIATHSSEILQGVLSRGAARTHVIRMSQKASDYQAKHLDPALITKFWSDPILRFSNALDGLFHDAVIVAEGDSDCRFFEAVADVAISPEARPDIHYTYSGGKHRLPIVVAALSAISVPVASIVDSDILRSEQPLRSLFEAHGGDWADIEAEWNLVRDTVEAASFFMGGKQFVAQIKKELLNCNDTRPVDPEVLKRIRDVTRQASPWDQVKRSGLDALPNGQASAAALRLMEALAEKGVCVVPVGEMEGFCRTIAPKGRRWVEEVLQKDIGNDPALASARAFMQRVVTTLTK